MKIRVKGYALVPVKVEMIVEMGRDEAVVSNVLSHALKVFESSQNKSDYVVSNSEDHAAVHDWIPSIAERIE